MLPTILYIYKEAFSALQNNRSLPTSALASYLSEVEGAQRLATEAQSTQTRTQTGRRQHNGLNRKVGKEMCKLLTLYIPVVHGL